MKRIRPKAHIRHMRPIDFFLAISTVRRNLCTPENGREIGKTRGLWQAHGKRRRTARETQTWRVLFAQELGVRSRDRMEPSPQSDCDRCCKQEVPSHAGPIRRRESDAAYAGTFSCTQSQRSDVDQDTREGRASGCGAKYYRKSRWP